MTDPADVTMPQWMRDAAKDGPPVDPTPDTRESIQARLNDAHPQQQRCPGCGDEFNLGDHNTCPVTDPTSDRGHVMYPWRAKNGKIHPRCLYCYQGDVANGGQCPGKVSYHQLPGGGVVWFPFEECDPQLGPDAAPTGKGDPLSVTR